MPGTIIVCLLTGTLLKHFFQVHWEVDMSDILQHLCSLWQSQGITKEDFDQLPRRTSLGDGEFQTFMRMWSPYLFTQPCCFHGGKPLLDALRLLFGKVLTLLQDLGKRKRRSLLNVSHPRLFLSKLTFYTFSAVVWEPTTELDAADKWTLETQKKKKWKQQNCSNGVFYTFCSC